jgi:hypothetical protein
MSINQHHGSFVLDCWTGVESLDDRKSLYSDNFDELRTEALKLLRGGHYRYLVLSRWHSIKKDWIKIELLRAE